MAQAEGSTRSSYHKQQDDLEWSASSPTITPNVPPLQESKITTTVRLVQVNHNDEFNRYNHDSTPHVQEYKVQMTVVGTSKDADRHQDDDTTASKDTPRLPTTSESQTLLVQKVAERYPLCTPEEFAILLADVLLQNLALESVHVKVEETVWTENNNNNNNTPLIRRHSPEQHHATIQWERGQGPVLTSSLVNVQQIRTVPNTTTTGVSTIFAPTLDITWSYVPSFQSMTALDYRHIRKTVRNLCCQSSDEIPKIPLLEEDEEEEKEGPPREEALSDSWQRELQRLGRSILLEIPHVQTIQFQSPIIAYRPLSDTTKNMIPKAPLKTSQSNKNTRKKKNKRNPASSFLQVVTPEPEPTIVTCTISRRLHSMLTISRSLSDKKTERQSRKRPKTFQVERFDVDAEIRKTGGKGVLVPHHKSFRPMDPSPKDFKDKKLVDNEEE